MARVRKRRGKWVVNFRDQFGKRHWETYETKKAADAACAERQITVRKGDYRDPESLPTFETVARRCEDLSAGFHGCCWS